MNGDDELPRRSSSPLKRRASSMDPEIDSTHVAADTDAPMSSASYDASPPHGLPRAMSIDVPQADSQDASPVSTAPPAKPPLLEQVKTIEMLLKAFAESPLEEGVVAYLVSRSWVDKALALRSQSKQPKDLGANVSLGPVDNSDIIDRVIQDSSGLEFVRLKPGSSLESFELFSEDAWKLVMDWYGLRQGQIPIVRHAVNTAESKASPQNIMYEFHPPVFRIYRLWSSVSPLPIEQSLKARNPPPLVLVRSSASHAQTFLKELKNYAGVPMDRKVRLFSLPIDLHVLENSTQSASALTPPDSPKTEGPELVRDVWTHLLLDTTKFSSVQENRLTVKLADQTNNEKFNGQATIQVFLATNDQMLVIDESIENHWVSTYNGHEKLPQRSIPSRSSLLSLAPRPNSDRASPIHDGPVTRSRTLKKRLGQNSGAVGLHNLGNTCYMNSALQCVRSVEELTKYFLSESYLTEINETNVLGYEGRVASAYGSLLAEVYEQGKSSVSPRDFKSTVGRCRPTFSGWGQQDTQEFLGFLLDALQEDLSRIKKKPYIEKPDSTDDMINNPDAIRKMADQVWDITRRRDDSVIADLFTGMYKSTLKCPECGKISITFDPFNNLTLPIPTDNTWTGKVKFFPLNDSPVKIEVELSKHSSVKMLKQFISDRTGVPVERLMSAEEYKDRFFKIYDDTGDVSEISDSDIATIHELDAVPTNWPGKAARARFRSMLDVDAPYDASDSDDEQCQTMVVSVIHRRPKSLDRDPEGLPPPHFITLNKEEARNYEVIKRKILEKVATFTTWTKLSSASRGDDQSDGTDADMVITTASDADSSGDFKVAAQSVEGEEDMVDVTMKDANGTQSLIIKHFNKQRPKVLDSAFLDPDLQNLFELGYFRGNSDGPVPTGWSGVDNTRQVPQLTDRLPNEERGSPESFESFESGNDDSSNEGTGPDASQTRMAEESSDEDALPVARLSGRPGRSHHRFGGGGRKKFKGHKTYGKKGNKRRDKQMHSGKQALRAPGVAPQPIPGSMADGGPLVRLHEGIVVDWSEAVWETLFGSPVRRQGTIEGVRTFTELETLCEPAIKLLRKRRDARKSRGLTLEECLDEFERAEILSEQDMWYCPRCKEHRRASKKFDLWKTPDILVAHLKRFSNSGWRREKLDTFVDFPVENLDLTSRVVQKEDGKDEIYDLIAVDDHYGGLGGGHYTAYAKNFMDGRWYNFNDSSVHAVSDVGSMVTSAAYLLFYRRRSRGPLGGPRFVDLMNKYEREACRSDDDTITVGSSNDSNMAAFGKSPASGDDQDDEETLPSYKESIRRSIETDQGAPMKSLNMTQGWNFDGLEDEGAKRNGDEAVAGFSGHDGSDEDGVEEKANATKMGDGKWHGQQVMSVPAQTGSDGGSEVVAEIHLDGDKASRVE
ncbi:hypothetical protein CDD82_6287 [Ophiocordyceps australis]|uniref:ubiquitinyl hydrolase 1 n=1 Tax=Ophiocordyceps australis TaxID=1399860 RepID=A0A2C5YXW8_9HYPO|nr:hypothetical protein CDD82_6287 [Ophiocordyceps australis]